MAFDSTIRIRQMNQAELSGFITPIVQAYLAGTGALSGIFYPRYSNPSGYLVSGAFISQTDLDSAITQALVYVSNTYYPNSNPSGFSTGISSGSLIPTGQLTGVFYPLNDNPSGYVTTGETGNFGGLNSVFITGNQDISGTKTFNNTGNFIQDLLLSGYPVVTGTNRIAPKTSGTYHYLGTDTFYGVAGMLQLGNANNNSGILMGFDGHGIPTIYGANLSNYQPDSPLSIYASSLIIGSRIDCNNSGNFLSGVFWNNNPVVTGGPYYLNSNPSGYISSGEIKLNPLQQNTNFNLGANPFYVNSTGSGISWTLPLINSCAGRMYFLKNRSWPLTLNCSGSDQIFTDSGVNSLTLNSGDSCIIGNDGQFWSVFGYTSGQISTWFAGAIFGPGG